MRLENNCFLRILELQQATSQHKAALEQQAMQLTMEFQQRKAQEDMMKRQHELQQEHAQAQQKFNMDMNRLNTGGDSRGGPGGAAGTSGSRR